MNRGLAKRIRHLEALVARGRHIGYGLAERVREAAGDLPAEQWCFIRDTRTVPFASAARVAHRQFSALAERAPMAGHPIWDEVDDILWYLDHPKQWRPRDGWDLLWRFARATLPNLPDDAPGPTMAPTARLRDLETALNTHDPRYAPPFDAKRSGENRPVPPPGTPFETYLPPSICRALRPEPPRPSEPPERLLLAAP